MWVSEMNETRSRTESDRRPRLTDFVVTERLTFFLLLLNFDLLKLSFGPFESLLFLNG